MKCIIILIALQLAFSSARPSDITFEIEKQKLIRFPEDPVRLENEQKSKEAKRILEEIDKINVALGYVKKENTRMPSILDSNKFLFPNPSYHPYESYHSDIGSLQPSIRKLNFIASPFASRHSQAFLSNEVPVDHQRIYYYLPKSMVVSPKAELPIKQSTDGHHKHTYIKGFRINGDEQDLPHTPHMGFFFVPRQLDVSEKSMDHTKTEKLTRIDKVPTARPALKVTSEKQRLNTKSSSQKHITTPSTSSTMSPPLESAKHPFVSLFHRPPNAPAPQKVQPKPVMQSVPLSLPPSGSYQHLKPDPPQNSDYNWETDSSEEDEDEKHIFSLKRKEMAEVQKDALKESGIIIQRLKVRKGGIAIAGPGGVATAGSGGTAIVGPGGYALTHPRSLTIAGPGAKVIAVPETSDLKDVLLRANSSRTLNEAGRIVATGPVIYYSPDDNTEIL